MSKDTFYFSHDYNARNDIKIKKLITKHGYLGYGIFWAIIEELYNNANALPLDYECIAYDMRTNENVIDSIINDFDLFVKENGFFGSASVERRLEQRNEKSLKAKESANKRWDKIKKDANALLTESECNAIKESKVNDINKRLLSEINISEVDISLLHYAKTAKEFQRLFIQNLEEKNASYIHQQNAKFGAYVTPIRLIIENKEGTIQDLRDVFSYLASPEGEFWKSNILSTAKLREQLPKLLMSARQVKPKQKPKEDKL